VAHPLPLPACIRMPAALVRRKGAPRPYGMGLRPTLPPTCCSRRSSGCGEQPGGLGPHATIEIKTPCGRDAHPMRAPPTKHWGRPSAQMTSPVPPQACPEGHLRLARPLLA
jgi:hypothetical protein